MSAGSYIRTRARKAIAGLLLLGLLCVGRAQAAGTAPVITQQPLSQSAPLLGLVSFSVTAWSDTTMTYQWYKNGAAILLANSSSYTILSVLGIDAGAYTVKVCNAAGCVTSDTAYLNIPPPPTITSQPQSISVIKNRSATFSVTATSSLSMTYQWYFNSSPIGGATSSTYNNSHANQNAAGNYRVVVANSTGGTTSQVAVLTILIPAGVDNQPQNVTNFVGQNASFSVGVSGTAPISYQWRLNGNSIAGATNSSLTLTNVQLSDAGQYSVQATNVAGSDTSSNARLVVLAPPSISGQPQDVTVMAGQNAGFSVTATGGAPLSCQWYFNGNLLAGATNPVLNVSQANSSNAGGYSVVVSNPGGFAASTVATLTVNPVPPVTLIPVQAGALSNAVGGFSFQVTVPQGYTYVVFASSDVQNWSPIATNVAQSASDTFTDPDPTFYAQRFYRTALELP